MMILTLENLYHRLLKDFQDEDNDDDEEDENDDEFNDENVDEDEDSSPQTNIGNLVMSTICLNLLERFTAVSPRFCQSFQKEANHGVRVLFHFVNNRRIQERFINMQQQQQQIQPSQSQSDKAQELVLMRNLLRSILLTLAHLSRFSSTSRAQWQEVNAVKNLLFYFGLKMIQMDLKVDLALAIANVVEEGDLEASELIGLLARMVSVSAKKIMSGRELNRFKGNFKRIRNINLNDLKVNYLGI